MLRPLNWALRLANRVLSVSHDPAIHAGIARVTFAAPKNLRVVRNLVPTFPSFFSCPQGAGSSDLAFPTAVISTCARALDRSRFVRQAKLGIAEAPIECFCLCLASVKVRPLSADSDLVSSWMDGFA